MSQSQDLTRIFSITYDAGNIEKVSAEYRQKSTLIYFVSKVTTDDVMLKKLWSKVGDEIEVIPSLY